MGVKINRYPLGGCGNVMILLIIDESSEYRRKAVGASPKGRRSFAERPSEIRRKAEMVLLSLLFFGILCVLCAFARMNFLCPFPNHFWLNQ